MAWYDKKISQQFNDLVFYIPPINISSWVNAYQLASITVNHFVDSQIFSDLHILVWGVAR